MDFNITSFADLSHYALPVLAIFVVTFCIVALMRRRQPSLGKAEVYNLATNEVYTIKFRETSIGSDKKCDIILNDQSCAKMHAVIVCDRDGWYIADPSGKGTTLVNGLKVKKRADIEDGSKILIGGVMLVFSLAPSKTMMMYNK